ncbi:hypothetical protein ES708_10860 [subsurface metagenome]
MQDLLGLNISDFKKNLIVVLAKVEIDSDGAGDFQLLPDVRDFSINTNIENEVSRFCSYSFSITCLNTNDQYSPFNTISDYYNWVKQGRRIKLYIGIKVNGTEKYYQTILGRIDRYRLGKRAGENVCTITGRDLMRTLLDYKLYSPNTYWGAIQTFNTIKDQGEYSMDDTCKGIYIAYLDSVDPYNGDHLSEIYKGSEWGYLDTSNEFSFLAGNVPGFNGIDPGNLKVYYFKIQVVENVVANILLSAGIFADEEEKNNWLASDYVSATGYSIDRVWFNTGTSAFEAIRLLAEVVQRRFYFDYAGNPTFKTKASLGAEVDVFKGSDIEVESIEEDISEVYNNIIILGEIRETLG